MILLIVGNVRARYVQRVQNPNQNQIQMVTPQKVMQAAGLVQQGMRFQTPVRAQTRAPNPMVRAVRPRTSSARARAPNNIRQPVNVAQRQVTSVAPVMNTAPRQRIAISRMATPNQMTQVQPIISVGTPKHVVSIANPPRAATIIRTPVSANFTRTSPANQIHTQNSASTSNTTTTTEDLEDSIQAARITKQPTVQQTDSYTLLQSNQVMQPQINETNDNRIVTLQTGTQMSVAEYKQRQAQGVVKQLTGMKTLARPMMQNRPARFAAPNTVRAQRPVMVRSRSNVVFIDVTNFCFDTNLSLSFCSKLKIIKKQTQAAASTVMATVAPQQQQPQPQPPTPNQQIINPEPPYVIEKEVRESAKMLIVLENGEQRLITFTLPKESCTVQELLEQIGVPFEQDTNIHCVAKPGLNIDYLVTVGVNLTETPSEIISAAENSLQMKHQEQQIYQNTPQPVQVVPKVVQKPQTQAMQQQQQQLQKAQSQAAQVSH